MAHEDITTPGAEIKKDGVFARGAAIALRLQGLRQAYPHALVCGDVMVQREVHLVCWQCRPDQAWVWAFVFARTFRRRPADAQRLLESFRHRVEQDPLSAGLEVIAGPRFQSLDLPVSQVGSNDADLHELVVVTDADQDGLQLYEIYAQDEDSPDFTANLDATEAAVDAASDAREAVEEARSRLQPPRSAADDTPLARLSERYVQDVHRHRYLIMANVFGMDEAFRQEFLSRLAADARHIATEELRVLLDSDNWQDRITAAWLAAFDRRTELRGEIAEHLQSDDMVGPVQGYSFALARFGTADDAAILATYLDHALAEPGFDQPWALGALLYLDTQLGTSNAARFLVPGGAWDQWCQATRVSAEYTNPRTEQDRITRLCILAAGFAGGS
jgi:Family of unknown function (DUF6000)